MEKNSRKSRLLLISMILLGKSAKLLKVVKLFKVAKPIVLFVSMSLSAIAYTFTLGPWLSILFVTLLLVHEMGHVVAMKLKGYETPTPVFIPFFGAVVFAPSFKDRDTEAFIGYGGPFLGTIGSLVVFAIWFVLPRETTTSNILIVGSYLGTFLNLFNLIPISPLDGGRITQAVGKWFKYVGLSGLIIFSFYFRQPVVLYIWIVVLSDLTILPVITRAYMITACWFLMVTLMSLGYGDQPTWVNVFDCLATLFFVVSIWHQFKTKIELDGDESRAELSKNERMKWLMYYVAITFVLLALIFIQLPFLPQGMK